MSIRRLERVSPLVPSWRRRPDNVGVSSLRTTLPIDEALLSAIDAEVARGDAQSRSAFVNEAIERELARREEVAIDAAIAVMAADPVYQEESERIMQEFAKADEEAWQQIED